MCVYYLWTILTDFFMVCLSGSIIIQWSFWLRLLCFVTSICLSGLLCVWRMLAFEWQLVAMATKMGPVDRSPVLLVVQAAAWFAVAVLVRVLRVRVFCHVVLHTGHLWWNHAHLSFLQAKNAQKCTLTSVRDSCTSSLKSICCASVTGSSFAVWMPFILSLRTLWDKDACFKIHRQLTQP